MTDGCGSSAPGQKLTGADHGPQSHAGPLQPPYECLTPNPRDRLSQYLKAAFTNTPEATDQTCVFTVQDLLCGEGGSICWVEGPSEVGGEGLVMAQLLRRKQPTP